MSGAEIQNRHVIGKSLKGPSHFTRLRRMAQQR